MLGAKHPSSAGSGTPLGSSQGVGAAGLACREPKAPEQHFVVNPHGTVWQKELETEFYKHTIFYDHIFCNYF